MRRSTCSATTSSSPTPRTFARDGTIVAAGRGDLDNELYLTLLASAGGDVPLILHGLAEHEVGQSVDFLRATLARTPVG